MSIIIKNILFGDQSEWGWSAEKKGLDKHPKFNKNLILELEHFKYVMIHALVSKSEYWKNGSLFSPARRKKKATILST